MLDGDCSINLTYDFLDIAFKYYRQDFKIVAEKIYFKL